LTLEGDAQGDLDHWDPSKIRHDASSRLVAPASASRFKINPLQQTPAETRAYRERRPACYASLSPVSMMIIIQIVKHN